MATVTISNATRAGGRITIEAEQSGGGKHLVVVSTPAVMQLAAESNVSWKTALQTLLQRNFPGHTVASLSTDLVTKLGGMFDEQVQQGDRSGPSGPGSSNPDGDLGPGGRISEPGGVAGDPGRSSGGPNRRRVVAGKQAQHG